MSTSASSPLPKTRKRIGDLSFPTALQAVIDGKRVSKREWSDTEIWVALIEGFLKIHKADGSEHALLVRDGDLLGTDWYIL